MRVSLPLTSHGPQIFLSLALRRRCLAVIHSSLATRRASMTRGDGTALLSCLISFATMGFELHRQPAYPPPVYYHLPPGQFWEH